MFGRKVCLWWSTMRCRQTETSQLPENHPHPHLRSLSSAAGPQIVLMAMHWPLPHCNSFKYGRTEVYSSAIAIIFNKFLIKFACVYRRYMYIFKYMYHCSNLFLNTYIYICRIIIILHGVTMQTTEFENWNWISCVYMCL